MTQPLEIVILSSALPEDIWLINKISDACIIKGIVLPVGKRFSEFSRFRVLKKTLRRYGIPETINQGLMYLYRKIVEQAADNREMKKLFTVKSYRHIEDSRIPILRIDDINKPVVCDFIREHAPELIVASGTSILKQDVLEAGAGRMINLHPGLAPQYRGRYGSYWPVYNHEPELVGTTIHFIDAGIDTGKILAQERVKYRWNDSAKTITYKQHKLGAELMLKCIQNFDVLSQEAYHKHNCPSRNYRTMGLRQYLRARRWIRKNRHGQIINERIG